jgi:uncharacterized protein (TIGR04551 family)
MTKGPIVSLVAAGVFTLFAVDAAAQAAPAPADPAPAKPAPAKPAPPAAPAPKPAPPVKPAAPPAEEAPLPGDQPAPADTAPPEPGTEPPEAEPDAPPEGEPPPAGQPPLGTSPVSPLQMWPQPSTDTAALRKQGEQRPETERAAEARDGQVFAEDWWTHARPILELHGYFRVRAELFHNFSLGRTDLPSQALWPMPADNHYSSQRGTFGRALCTQDESASAGGSDDSAANAEFPCKNKTQAGANMRFRFSPELHISDNLRVMSQIDVFDNLVLGSTPEGYANSPDGEGGYRVAARSGYAPIGARDQSQETPSAGINSLRDSIRVKRAWAEYATPVGQLRFGRMPHHWGLGILYNAGDGYDDDYQSTIDRIQFTTGLKALDLYIAGSWDFPNEGPTSDSLALPQSQPYDVAQLDDVDQYSIAIFRRKDPELLELALSKGELVLNGGAYVVYRRQLLANDLRGSCTDGAASLGCPTDSTRGGVDDATANLSAGYERRGANIWTPDLWIQLLYKKFRLELEAVTVQGSLETTNGSDYLNPDADGDNGWRISEWGIAGEIEQKLVEDRLRLQLHAGWASGDPDVSGFEDDDFGSGPGGLQPGLGGFQPQRGDRTVSTFRFNPSYRVDLILNRNILSRIQGVYYFRPGVEYDFVRHANGQRLGGSFAGIWTRGTQFVQTPGHARDLGIELNGSLYFQSKDGALNDKPGTFGGFFTMLQYGVLFPLGGLGYQDKDIYQTNTTTAQALRWYLGVFY